MNKLDLAISRSKRKKPYYHKIILDFLVQITTEDKYRSLTAFKQSGEELNPEQREVLRQATLAVICMLDVGMSFSEIKEFLKK